MFQHAIVRRPSKHLVQGLTTAIGLGLPDYAKALRQHDAYIDALEKCGLRVTVMEGDDEYPDCCFVEDTAVVTRRGAVVTNPGAPSRKGEVGPVDEVLKRFFEPAALRALHEPDTLEGGDVMMVGDHFYVGLSARTNEGGAAGLFGFLREWGMTGSTVAMEKFLHLKTGLAYLEDNILLVAGEFADHPEFAAFRRIPVPPGEEYAANCVRVNDRVLVPEGFPATRRAIEDAGLATLAVDTSEFRKLDGGLSCLSLRF